MKSMQMKALALAVLGLAGFGVAGSALACPTIPTTTATPGGGGAWSTQTVTSATMSSQAGLNGTTCALGVALNVGAQSNAKGLVKDNSPNNEARYRARFYVDTSQLTKLTAANQQVDFMTVLAGSSPAGVSTTEVEVKLVGGTPLQVDFIIANTGAGGANNYQTIGLPMPNTGGKYRIEFDLQQGAQGGTCTVSSTAPTGGCFRYWVSDAAATTAPDAATGAVSVTNTGWSGAKQANLGLAAANTKFRTASVNPLGQTLVLDEFDSRRQTFIGK